MSWERQNNWIKTVLSLSFGTRGCVVTWVPSKVISLLFLVFSRKRARRLGLLVCFYFRLHVRHWLHWRFLILACCLTVWYESARFGWSALFFHLAPYFSLDLEITIPRRCLYIQNMFHYICQASTHAWKDQQWSFWVISSYLTRVCSGNAQFLHLEERTILFEE